jgi:hypothetical protein
VSFSFSPQEDASTFRVHLHGIVAGGQNLVACEKFGG